MTCGTARLSKFTSLGTSISSGTIATWITDEGSDDTLEDTVSFLYSQWLPQSGEELRDFPLFFQRVNLFPSVPEHEAITDVFLPLATY